MALDLTSPPSLRPLIREDVLVWAQAAASGTKAPSELRDEGLRFLEEWEHLDPENREVVGEITDALFGMEDMGESFEDVQRVAQEVLRDVRTMLDELARFVVERELLIERPLISALASFAFSPGWTGIAELELLIPYLHHCSKESSPVNRGLADESLPVLKAVKQREIGIHDGKRAIGALLACLNPILLKGYSPAGVWA